jgi:hypothetical protein
LKPLAVCDVAARDACTSGCAGQVRWAAAKGALPIDIQLSNLLVKMRSGAIAMPSRFVEAFICLCFDCTWLLIHIYFCIVRSMTLKLKPLKFLGSSHDDLCAMPEGVRRAIGVELMTVQFGGMPSDFKPMPTVGAGA